MPSFELDLTGFLDAFTVFGQLPPHLVFWFIFKYVGWIPIFFTFLYGLNLIYIDQMKSRYASKQVKLLLAIDIPKDNEQTPKAVENILSQLAGGHTPIWWWDVYKGGDFQQLFSLEIVSIEGHVQFLVHLNARFRDLVEASIFAQYPQARITEVSDYTKGFPSKFPNDEYDLWGTEFVFVKNSVYPIKVYNDFGDSLSQEYKDPMAALLEIMSRMGKGEHIWYQILVMPIDQTWAGNGQKEIDRLLGKKSNSKKRLVDVISDAPINAVKGVGNIVFGAGEGGDSGHKESGPRSAHELPPGELNTLKLIDEKCTKIGFLCKIRLVYLAKHDVFNKAKAAYPLVGAIKQYNTQDANSLKPDYKIIGIGGDYFFKYKKHKVLNARKRDLMMGYRKRLLGVGTEPIIFNIEELASLYHFPILSVKAPLVKKIEMKTAEPPADLPGLGESDLPIFMQNVINSKISSEEEQEPVDGTPNPFDYNNDYFEKRFGVGKTKTLEDIVPRPPKSLKSENFSSDENIKDSVDKDSFPPNLPV